MKQKNTIITVLVVGILAAVGIGAAAMNKDDSMEMSSSDMNSMQDTSMNPSNDQMSSSMQETNQVTYKGFAVVQKTIKVKKGTTVTWTNEDNAKHDVTFSEDYPGLKNTELFGKGETKSITFDTAGTYDYICSPHPYMKGTVEVTE